jgi:hypothetical protein
MVSTSTLDAEIGVVVAAIFVVLVGVYALYRYLRRRGPELAAREGKSVLDDRAYNQIRIGQAAAERLAATGVDVSGAKGLLEQAEVARAGGNYNGAIELAKKANDTLYALRSGGNGVLSSSAARSGGFSSVTPSPLATSAARPTSASKYTAPPSAPYVAAGSLVVADPGMTPEPVSNRPPKNKMEAHFQLSLAQEELDQARSTKAHTSGFQGADAMRRDGQAAYDRQDYTEALRLALRSRRTLGARIEALPVSPALASAGGPGSSGAASTGPLGSSASQPSFGQKCPECGRTAAPTDQFCRTCGAPIAPALCSNCGAPLLAGDRFCGKCGATQA